MGSIPIDGHAVVLEAIIQFGSIESFLYACFNKIVSPEEMMLAKGMLLSNRIHPGAYERAIKYVGQEIISRKPHRKIILPRITYNPLSRFTTDISALAKKCGLTSDSVFTWYLGSALSDLEIAVKTLCIKNRYLPPAITRRLCTEYEISESRYVWVHTKLSKHNNNFTKRARMAAHKADLQSIHAVRKAIRFHFKDSTLEM